MYVPFHLTAGLFFNLLLVEYVWHLWHPLLPPLAPELPFRRQIARMVQCPRHNIPEVLHRRCTHFQYTASTRRTEFPVKCCAATIVCFVDRGLLGFGSI